MSKALLVDTGFSALPIFDALKSLDLEVHVVGGRPSDPLALSGDVYHPLDYSDLTALSELMSVHNFDYLIPGCTDKSYEVCAHVALPKHPGIDSQENTKKINDKRLFRETLALIGVPAPRAYRGDELHELSRKVIVKPVDSFSGRGITVVENPSTRSMSTAIEFAQKYSPSGEVIVEDFISGQLYSYSCFISSGSVKIGFFVREDCQRTKFAVDTSAVCHSFPEGIATQISGSVEAIAAHLGLVDGLFHIQFILNESGFWILEATRRCPGDLYSILVELSTEYKYATSYVAGFIGQPVAKRPIRSPSLNIIRHTLAGQGAPYFSYIAAHEEVKFIRCYPVTSTGNPWHADRANRCAILFVEPSGKSDFSKLYEELSAGALFFAG